MGYSKPSHTIFLNYPDKPNCVFAGFCLSTVSSKSNPMLQPKLGHHRALFPMWTVPCRLIHVTFGDGFEQPEDEACSSFLRCLPDSATIHEVKEIMAAWAGPSDMWRWMGWEDDKCMEMLSDKRELNSPLRVSPNNNNNNNNTNTSLWHYQKKWGTISVSRDTLCQQTGERNQKSEVCSHTNQNTDIFHTPGVSLVWIYIYIIYYIYHRFVWLLYRLHADNMYVWVLSCDL